MRALGENRYTLVQCVVNEDFAVYELEALQAFGSLQPALLVFVYIEFKTLVLSQHLQMGGLASLVSLLKIGQKDIPHPESAATCLIGVGRAYALEGRTYLRLAHCTFAGGIQGPVGGKDEVGPLGDEETSVHIHPAGFDIFDFLHQDDRIDDHAVADYVQRALAEDSGRNRMKHEGSAVEHQRMTGVGAALEACNNLVIRRQYVHDFAFALVAPLEAENNIDLVCFHLLIR